MTAGGSERPREDRGRMVVVLGMHRSGTSAVAEAVVRLGVAVGDSLSMDGPSEWNPRGYFEDPELNRINDAVLEAIGGSWAAPPEPVAKLPPQTDRQLAERMRAYVKRTVLEGGNRLWKDPRLCLTYPMWGPLLPEAVVVVVWRHPWEVARSLRRKYHFPVSASFHLWETYVRAAVANSDDVPRALVGYGELVEDPEGTLARLRGFLGRSGVHLTESGIEKAVRAIDPALRRHDEAHRAASSARPENPTDRGEGPAPDLTPSQERLLGALRESRFPELDYPVERPESRTVLDALHEIGRWHRTFHTECARLLEENRRLASEKRIYEDSYNYVMRKPAVRAYRAVKGVARRLFGGRRTEQKGEAGDAIRGGGGSLAPLPHRDGHRDHRVAVGGMWDDIGRLQFEFLVENGLTPQHKLLDIGCGSLRGGVRFIGYLDDGNYYGMDKDGWLLDAGVRIELPKHGLEDRAVHLLCGDDFDFARFDTSFDFAVAYSVFTHLTWNSILKCLVNVREALSRGGRLYATFFEDHDGRHRASSMRQAPGGVTTYPDRDPYHYEFSAFTELAARASLGVEYIGEVGHPKGQRMMVMRRA